MNPNDVPETAMYTPMGFFEYVFITFGLRDSGQTQQRYLQRALGDFRFVYFFTKYILVASEDEAQHEKHLFIVFERLEKILLRANLEKIVLGQPKVVFLRSVQEKDKAVLQYPTPETIHRTKMISGMVNFYLPFLPHAAKTQRSSNAFLKNSRKKDKRPVTWDESSIAAFKKWKWDLNPHICAFFQRHHLITGCGAWRRRTAPLHTSKGAWRRILLHYTACTKGRADFRATIHYVQWGRR